MNRLSSILGAAAVVAIGLVFVVQFRPATGVQSAEGPTCAAEVRNTCIPTSHFSAAYRLIAPRGVDEETLKSIGLRTQVMNGLIERQLLEDDAKRLGVRVSDDEVTQELGNGRAHVSLPANTMPNLGRNLGLADDSIRFVPVVNPKTNKFDPAIYEKQIRLITKLSPVDFRDFEKQELTAQRVRELVRQRVQISESEAFTQFTQEKETAVIDSVKLDRRYYADAVIDRSPEAIRAWADKNKAEVDKAWESRKSNYAPECRVVRHILAKLDEHALDPDAEKAKSKQRIDDAIARLDKGESFAKVADAVSDDRTPVSHGGELGCVQKAQSRLMKPLEDAVFALEEGKRSGPIETELGYQIVQVDKIAKGADAEAIGRAQTERDLYLAQESERLTIEGAKEINAAMKGGKSLSDALTAYLATLPPPPTPAKDARPLPDYAQRPVVETSMPFSIAGSPLTGVAPGGSVAQMAFALDKPGDSPNDVVPLEVGYAVIQLKEKKPPSDEQWQKEREFYLSAMRSTKQRDALTAYVDRLRAGSQIKVNTSLTADPKPGTEEGS